MRLSVAGMLQVNRLNRRELSALADSCNLDYVNEKLQSQLECHKEQRQNPNQPSAAPHYKQDR